MVTPCRVTTWEASRLNSRRSRPSGGAWPARLDRIVRRTMLSRAATLDDVGNVAALVASDQARTMPATALNITCGAQVD